MEIEVETLLQFDRLVPRYTSYPTALKFSSIENSEYVHNLSLLNARDDPISLYVHIPFCKSMCLFCGCSVILNRSDERRKTYVSRLIQEIELLKKHLPNKKECLQLHFGGGTPTSLSVEEMDQIIKALQDGFHLNGEIAIEIDPRTVFLDKAQKLKHLRSLGFNRVSFGVQDLNEKVQEAVKRRQSEEMSYETFSKAREFGFSGINLDLIYGLPYQTIETFQKTATTIAKWKPDRIALFSYAKVPHLKPHQKAIPEHALPKTFEKFQIYLEARRIFLEAGYVAIGMDHFALPEDTLSKAFHEKKLHRNFQGYTIEAAEDLIPLGVTSIGCIGGNYFQNVKSLEEYEARLDAKKLSVFRGVIVSEEDERRRFVIQSLMCRFEVDKKEFFSRFNLSFDEHFKLAKMRLEKELVEEDERFIRATPLGELLIRLVASAFDEYLFSPAGSRLI